MLLTISSINYRWLKFLSFDPSVWKKRTSPLIYWPLYLHLPKAVTSGSEHSQFVTSTHSEGSKAWERTYSWKTQWSYWPLHPYLPRTVTYGSEHTWKTQWINLFLDAVDSNVRSEQLGISTHRALYFKTPQIGIKKSKQKQQINKQNEILHFVYFCWTLETSTCFPMDWGVSQGKKTTSPVLAVTLVVVMTTVVLPVRTVAVCDAFTSPRYAEAATVPRVLASVVVHRSSVPERCQGNRKKY